MRNILFLFSLVIPYTLFSQDTISKNTIGGVGKPKQVATLQDTYSYQPKDTSKYSMIHTAVDSTNNANFNDLSRDSFKSNVSPRSKYNSDTSFVQLGPNDSVADIKTTWTVIPYFNLNEISSNKMSIPAGIEISSLTTLIEIDSGIYRNIELKIEGDSEIKCSLIQYDDSNQIVAKVELTDSPYIDGVRLKTKRILIQFSKPIENSSLINSIKLY